MVDTLFAFIPRSRAGESHFIYFARYAAPGFAAAQVYLLSSLNRIEKVPIYFPVLLKGKY